MSESIRHTIDKDALEHLERIGRAKNSLPFSQRGWCNELGLFVQLREAMGMARLEAGGKFRTRIDLRRESEEGNWQVKKYRPGAWEHLISPTLQLAEWLAERGGLSDTVTDVFKQSIKNFHTRHYLALPQGITSFCAGSEFGRIFGKYPGNAESWNKATLEDILAELRAYAEVHPNQGAVWDSLRRVYERLQRYREALDAAKQAVSCALEEPEFQFNLALLYVTPITNAIRSASGTKSLEPHLDNCTFESIGCSYEQASLNAQEHLEAALVADIPSRDYKQAAIDALGRLPEMDRIYKYWYTSN